MKVSTSSEDAFLIRSDNFNYFNKSNFYIQKNKINDSDFYKKIDLSNGVFFIENVIAEFCKSIVQINENTWWLYVAEYESSGIKFVAGVGNGIVFSRIIEQSKDYYENFKENIKGHVLKTLQYIKRFGFKDKIKIISAIDNFVIENEFIDVFDLKKNLFKGGKKNTKDIEYILIDFLNKNKKIKTRFVSETFFKHFFKKYINAFWFFILLCFLILGFWFWNVQKRICDLQRNINQNKKIILSANDLSNTFDAKIDINNFEYIQCVTNILKQSKNPINVIKKISDILQKHKIQIEIISIKRCDDIKIKCRLNKKIIEKLKELSNSEMEIHISKSENQIADYEEIEWHKDKNFGAEICIKLK